jgi:hypothetical protein
MERGVREAVGPSTLLGPEGTAASVSPDTKADLGQDRILHRRAMQVRDRPYLENCTVDASIICSCQVDKGTR